MRQTVSDLDRMPAIDQYEEVCLLTLSEECMRLEEKLREIAEAMPEKERQYILAYIDARDDLEVETTKAALRWGKRHYL